MSSGATTKLHPLSAYTRSTNTNTNTTTASSRGLSPSGRPCSAFAVARGMPSPRTSPALRPSAPLCPAYKTSGYFDSLQPPQQRPMHARANSGPHQQQRRAPSNSLRLPALPRFHPANFPSAHSSMLSTPDGTSCASSPQPPVSPRAFQRIYNDAQKQLYFNQRELFSAVVSSPTGAGKPTSPRLQPLGSPGPVTPLELEGDEGYLVAGARSMGNAATSSEVAERMIKAEVHRQRNLDATGSRSTPRS